MKKILGWVVLIIVLAVASVVGKIIGRGAGNTIFGERISKKEISSREFLLRVAGEINKSMPMQIDRDTEIRNVSADNGQLIYNYVLVNYALAEIDRAYFEQAMKPRLRTMACSNPDMANLWQYGISAVYSYQAKDGAFITKIAVTPQDCGY